MRRWVIVAAVLGGICGTTSAYNAAQVNAKAVSVHWRHGWENWAGMCCECYPREALGSIRVHTIANGQVVDCDTIYGRELGLAHYPAFNVAGTKIVFYRSARAPAAEPNSAYPTNRNCTTVNGGKRYISLIDIGGTNLRNLCEISNEPAGEMALDWPGGDYVYYVCPRPAADAWSGNTESMEVWKVNTVSGDNEQVCDFTNATGHVFKCHYWRRFALNLAGNKVAGQIMSKYACTWDDGYSLGGNSVWNFPVCNLDGQSIDGRAGCNISISPSGDVLGSFFAGSHADFMLDQDTPGAINLGSQGWGFNRELHVEAWAGEDVGEGSELIRWAVNSDKWALQNVGWWGHADQLADGNNQIACDWIDHVAFNITKNPKLSGDGVMKWNSCTGDMWIDDPQNNPERNKYEDLTGNWQAAPGAPPTHVPGYAPHAPAPERGEFVGLPTGDIGLGVALAPGAMVIIADLSGRTLRSVTTDGTARVSPGELAPGTYCVTVKSGGITRSARMVLAR